MWERDSFQKAAEPEASPAKNQPAGPALSESELYATVPVESKCKVGCRECGAELTSGFTGIRVIP